MNKPHLEATRKLIANKIKRAREEAGLSQRTLAETMFCDQSTISYIERGKVGVPLENLVEFSNALNKPIIYFLSDIV
ncbi:helix-turn-helix domain-containing protein [Scytonema sp. NUACC26]|uniref:helix-turn-helix domain-containing protein n=1 Tax=Scytonema sp. NUACC26 TaxID=3140176 RepID=UPI0034DBD7FA